MLETKTHDMRLTDRVRVGRLSAHAKIDICRGLFAFLVVIAHAA